MEEDDTSSCTSMDSSNSIHNRHWQHNNNNMLPPLEERFNDIPEPVRSEMVKASLSAMQRYLDGFAGCILRSINNKKCGICSPCADTLSWVVKTASKAGVDVGKYETLLMQVAEEEERIRKANTRQGIWSDQFYHF